MNGLSNDIIYHIISLQMASEHMNRSCTLNIPKIVVVGPQSCGKSTILAYLVNSDIFPIGPALETKCPLIVTFKRSLSSFWKVGRKTFYKIEEAKQEIQRLMDLIGNKIIETPIYVDKHGTDEINMTIIDLPGLIQIPRDDQAGEIDVLSERIIKNYIKQSDVLILAVIDGTLDVYNSDALMLAKSVDPKLERTVGVVTKMDLIDKSSNIFSILRNDLIYLKHGYIVMSCRRRDSKRSFIPIEILLEMKVLFILINPHFQKISKYFGVDALRTTVYAILFEIAANNFENFTYC